MATNIPPHNMREVIDGVDRAHRASAGSRERGRRLKAVLKTIPGPDFPTGGFIVGRAGDFPGLHDRPRLDHAARQGRRRRNPRRATRSRSSSPRSRTRSTRSGCSRTSPTWCARRRSRASPICATSRIATACAIVIELKRGEVPEVDPQQPLQAHAAADDVRHHHAGDRRRPAARPAARRHHRALHRVPARGRAAAHRVRAAQGGSPRAHPRRPARSPSITSTK